MHDRGAALDNTVIPEQLDGDTITANGEALRAIVVGQADIPNNTVLHIPSLAAVVAGDVVYNGINPFLAVSDPDGGAAGSRAATAAARSMSVKSEPGQDPAPRPPT